MNPAEGGEGAYNCYHFQFFSVVILQHPVR